MIVGNDVSQFQGDINWDTYKNNSNFVIIRATYGNGYFDQWFARNRDEARRVGIPRGYYHYCYPQYNTPENEAIWFSKAVWDLQEGESVYLDYEENWPGDAVLWCKTFLENVSKNFNGIKPMIYLNQSLVAKYNWLPIIQDNYALWLASYQADGVGNIGQWPSMAMQQTSSTQQVPGIVGNVDRDVFFGDNNAFLAYGYKKPVPTPPVTNPPPPPTPPVPPTEPAPPPAIPDVCKAYKDALAAIKTIAYGNWYSYLSGRNKVRTIITQSGV